MTARASATVTVRMLQGMAGEQLTLEPGDLYEVPAAQAKLWAEHGVAEIFNAAPVSKASTRLAASSGAS
jgi:hypothetical protein